MVWAIAIICTSLSCEPLPIIGGWFYSEQDCITAAHAIMSSWKPEIGFYSLSCFQRIEI